MDGDSCQVSQASRTLAMPPRHRFQKHPHHTVLRKQVQKGTHSDHNPHMLPLLAISAVALISLFPTDPLCNPTAVRF